MAIDRSGWNLYWVSSDGEEDCFVVARNSRSAARVEAHYCGFETNQLTVTRVRRIPQTIVKSWLKRRQKEGYARALPWYADEWLLRKLGARFRERENFSETLIDDIVYANATDGVVPPRTIGRRFIQELRGVKIFAKYGHEDRYSQSQMALFTILGICVARCQEIERLIAHSFILGALSKAERRRYRTISDLIRGWERKTLGQMLRAIEEGYEIEPTVHAALQLFLNMRNRLVHGLTTDQQYNIHSVWGQDETIGFLALFELISRPIREAFTASFYASIDFGNRHFLRDEPEKHQRLTKRQEKLISLFDAFFKPRIDAP